MFRILLIISIMLATTASLSYVNMRNPEIIQDLMVKVDVFGISEAASQERVRLNMIRQLDIPFEKKKVLMERTIFIGATSQMVYLSLGNPDAAGKGETITSENQEDIIVQKWIYYLQNDSHPTVLEFHNDVLASAYKGSKIDLSLQ